MYWHTIFGFLRGEEQHQEALVKEVSVLASYKLSKACCIVHFDEEIKGCLCLRRLPSRIHHPPSGDSFGVFLEAECSDELATLPVILCRQKSLQSSHLQMSHLASRLSQLLSGMGDNYERNIG